MPRQRANHFIGLTIKYHQRIMSTRNNVSPLNLVGNQIHTPF
jgi:hypothetical protein